MKEFLHVMVFIVFVVPGWSQDLDVELTNSKPIEDDRYNGIKGSPYFYEDREKND